MVKDKVIHECIECTYKTTKWFGQCANCKAWGTMEEHTDQKQAKYIAQRSKKGWEHKRKLDRIKKSVTDYAKRKGKYFCWGCNGKCSGTLSHAHLISESQDEWNRLNKDNIWLMNCGSSDSCHDRWGSGDIKEMVLVPAFDEIMLKVKGLNSFWYNRLVTKLNEKGLNKWDFKYTEI